jgi:iron complex transport system substrate-binding protein
MARPASYLLTFLHLLICFSCATKPSPVPEISGGTNGGGDTRVYTDGIGRQVTLPKHPLRIVSLAPSVTEVISLVGADERLIGVTTHCDWPESVRTKPKLGDLINPNYELLLTAKPDLVIASTAGNDRTAVLKLADLGLPVFVTAPRSVDKILETVTQIGRITDCAAQGDALASRMKARLDDIERRLAGLAPLRAFFITWFDPLLAPGKETFENDVLRLAGVASISADIDQFYPRYSLEQVLARDPDVIITVNHESAPLPDLSRLAGWQKLRAVREKRIYILNEVFQHPSPRFVDGVEELARKLHPERFQ